MILPVPSNLVQQFVVQFACRTPTVREISSADRKALKDMLSQRNAEMFRLFDREVSEAPPNLFQSGRQCVIGPMTVTVPSLIIAHNSVTLLYPVQLGPRSFINNTQYESGYLNSEMMKTLFEIQNILAPRITFNRAGKIFEIALGPLPPPQKNLLLKKVFSYTLDEVGEVNLFFTPYRHIENNLFNLQTRIAYQQAELDREWHLTLRVDINNRDQKDSLEPLQVQQVWDKADRVIGDYLQQVLEYPRG